MFVSQDLAEWMDGVVLPAVRQVLRAGELVYLALEWDEIDALLPDGRYARTPALKLLLRVTDGEEYRDVVFDQRSGGQLSKEELIARLVSNLVDFAAESRFAWGEDRTPK